jgi:hypothetical protein
LAEPALSKQLYYQFLFEKQGDEEGHVDFVDGGRSLI